MEDYTKSDSPGIELDAEMAQQIIDHGDQYTQQTANLAEFVLRHAEDFRAYLVSHGFIQVVAGAEGFDLAAVDGASAVQPHGGGALVAASAYKTTISDEKQRGVSRAVLVPNTTELESFATLLRLHLELSLLAGDKLDSDKLVILDHSFWGVMQAVSRALATYKLQRRRVVEANRSVDRDAMLQAWLALFGICLGQDGSLLRMISNKQVLSLSKTGISQYFMVQLMQAISTDDPVEQILATTLNDRAVLRHVLKPGEYTTPQTLYRLEQEGSSVKSWKRSRFATAFEAGDGPDPFAARDAVLDHYGVPRDDDRELSGLRVFVTYYYPHAWSRVYRIEFHERMLANKEVPNEFVLSGQGERFQRILASVRRSVNPETKEPLSQVLADIRAKAATAAAISVLPERAFYQLRDQYRARPELLDVIDTLTAEERT
jgi:hypothetical protein